MALNIVITWAIALFALFISVFWIHIYLTGRDIVLQEPAEWPTVSILVPAYNEEATIGQCIESLLDLDYPEDKLSIAVVDDGSTDETLAVAKEYESDPRVTIYTKENGGKAHAMNYGLDRIDDEFVACMDADSMVTPDALKKLVSAFTDETIGSVTGAMKIYQPETLMQKLQAVEYVMAIWLRRQMGLIDTIQAIPGPFSLYRKEVLDEVGYFDVGNLTEDGEMAMRLHYNGYHIKNVPDADIYTHGPATLKGLMKQRLRWYRGLFRNSLKYREMMFRPQYGNFGLFYMPMMWISVLILLLTLYLFSWNVFRVGSTLFERLQIGGFLYFLPDLQRIDLIRFLLGIDYLLVLPALFTLAIGIYVLKYSFKEAREPIRGNIGILFIYMIGYFLCLGGFWLMSFLEELLHVERDW